MATNNYDFIAPYYVLIRTIVFGRKTEKVFRHFLQRIKPGDKVLIVGGGAGRILLDENLRQPGVEIFYLEKSRKMIALAKKRGEENVNFIQGDILLYKTTIKYDVIILPFVLDLFNKSHMVAVINSVSEMLKARGVIIVSDFAPPGTFLHKALLKLMFLFFRITTNIESRELPDIEGIASESNLVKNSVIHFNKGFIFSAVYQKPEN